MPKMQVNCPQCRQPILADIQQLFDVGEQPQDKQVFLSGSFNIASCPHCGYQGRLTTPLVYHDPEKELLLTYFPPEMGATLNEQQKRIGPIINRIVDRLPQEKRKGYLFNPKTMLTLQVMVENILQADGITKEMIQAQEKRLSLIQRLLSATSEENRIEVIQLEDALIDDEFFGLFSRLMEASHAGQDESTLRQMNDLQQTLLHHSTHGMKLLSEAQEVQAAMQSLQELGEEITREKLLDLVIKAPNDTRLRALVRFARAGMDYTFFQILSERIERGRTKGRARLVELRDKLLAYTKEIDDDHANRQAVARQNVERILQSEDIKATLEHNFEAVDEYFIQAVTQAIEQARGSGDIQHSARLQQVLDAVDELTAPPEELVLIEELLELANDNDALEAAVASHADDITAEFMQMLNVLYARTQGGVENPGDAENEQQDLLKRLEKLYGVVVGFSMRRNLQKG